MKKIGLLMCAIAVFGMMFTSCKKKDSVNLDNVTESTFFVVGPATAVLDMDADNSQLAQMGAGINEKTKQARSGLFEKYVALEANQEFELVYNDGGMLTHYGADLELGDPYDVADGITIQVYKGEMKENVKMTVPVSGFYHIALDQNLDKELEYPTIIVSPVEWELSDGTPLQVASEFNKTSMTWTLDEKEFASSSKYKYRWGHGWKIRLANGATEVNIETNLGEGYKSGASDIKIKRGVWSFTLTWNLTGGAIENGFKNSKVTLVRALEAADYSATELVVVGAGVNDEYPSDYANADGGWGWGHIASLGTPAKDGDVYTWTADVKLVGGQGFKVRSNKTTDANPVEIGDGPDQDKNFTVGGNGTYKVTVVIDAAADEKTVTIVAGEDVVIADYTNSVVGLVGAAVAEQDGAEPDAVWSWGNFFSLGTPAKVGMVYTWTGTVKLQEGGCKFRSATTDADPYVEVGKDGGGDNITIAAGEEGTYVVTLIIDAEKATKTVTVTKQ